MGVSEKIGVKVGGGAGFIRQISAKPHGVGYRFFDGFGGVGDFGHFRSLTEGVSSRDQKIIPKIGGREGTLTGLARDFKPVPGKTPLLVVEPFGPSFLNVIARIEEDPNFQVVVCATSLEATSLVSSIESCLVLCHADTQTQIVKHITMMKLLRHDILNGHVRVIVNTNIRQVNILSLLSFYGCTEILPDPITPRAVHFKLQRHAMAIQNARSKGGAGGAGSPSLKDAGVRAGEGAGQLAEGSASSKAGKIRLTDPLTILSDFWQVSRGTARVLGAKWVVKLPGPPLQFGSWKERPGSGGTVWDWESTQEDSDVFIRDPGTWVFRGQRPEFKDRLWWFVAERPKLSFEKEGQRACDKFAVSEDGVLLIARDSETTERAGRKLDEIFSSLDEKAKSEPTSDPRKSGRRIPGFQVEDPLRIDQDIWLLQERKPRWINSIWVVHLLGPAADAGKWVEFRRGGPERIWRWVPMGTESGVDDSGSWEFSGRQPKHEGGEWVFVGEKPKLEFVKKEEALGAKMRPAESGDLVLSSDSEAAARFHQVRGKAQASKTSDEPPEFRDLRGNWKEEVREIRDLRGSVASPSLEARRATAPTLSPLALACVVSDLMGRRGANVQFIRNHACMHLSAALGGVNVELWHRSAGSWRCVGAFDEGESKLGEMVSARDDLESAELGVPEGSDPMLWVLPLAPGVFLGIFGRHLNEVPVEFARASARIFRGIVSALSEESQAA